MQIALEVRRVLHKHPDQVGLQDFKLRYDNPKRRAKQKKKGRGTSLASSRISGPTIIHYVDRDGNPVKAPERVEG